MTESTWNHMEPEFHIHVDALSIERWFETELVSSFGFRRVEYAIDREPDRGRAGAHNQQHSYHLTFKTSSNTDFRQICDAVFDIVQKRKPIQRGYIECEYTAFRASLNHAPFRTAVLPVRLTMRPPETWAFRQSELHITLSRDDSDHRLLSILRDEIGMLSGFIPKPWGIAQILTAQGSRGQIQQIRQALCDFLPRVGGAVRCSVKEERTVRYWMSHGCDIGLPYVVNSVQTLSTERDTP